MKTLSDNNSKACVSCSFTNDESQVLGGRIYDSRYWVAEHAFGMNLPGFLIIKTKRHVEEVGELTPAEAKELGMVLQRVAHAVQGATGAEKVYVLRFGEVVTHIHFWIFPRTAAVAEAIGKGPKAIPQIVQHYKVGTIVGVRLARIRQMAQRIRRILDAEGQRSSTMRRSRRTHVRGRERKSRAEMSSRG